MFKLEIEKMESNYGVSPVYKENVIESIVVATREEAMKIKRMLIKKYDLKKYAGHIVNWSNMNELVLNF